MARLKKFLGGVDIAANGYAANLVIENLEADPSSVEAGRVWFNKTEGTYKGGHLDADGNVIVLTLGGKEELDSFIEELASQDVGHGSVNVGYAGHNGANDKFNLPAGNLEDTLASLVDGIDSDRVAIEDNLEAVEAEIAGVQAELDATQAGAGLGEDGKYTAKDDANYISEATSLKDATEKLDAQSKVNADAITSETTRATDAETTLQSNIDAEATARQDADTALQTYLDDNFVNKTVTDVEQVIKSAVRVENDLYVSGDITFNGGTITEVATEQMKVSDNIVTLNSDVPEDTDPTENAGIEINRGSEGVMPFIQWDEADDTAKVVTGKDADGNWILDPIATGGDAAALQDEVNRVEAGAGLDSDGNYVANADANYISEATSLADADNKLDAQVKVNTDAIAQEVSDRTDADSALQTAINDEITARTNADSAIQDELDATQTGAGLGEDGSYTANADANYIANATSLVDADNKLDVQVKKNADDIAALADTSSDADEAIRSEINSTRATYQASDAATSYTIEHNLGSEFVDVCVWCYDSDDEKYYNDDVIVSVIDSNKVQVDLTSAVIIRAVITNVEHQF